MNMKPFKSLFIFYYWDTVVMYETKLIFFNGINFQFCCSCNSKVSDFKQKKNDPYKIKQTH